MTVETELAALRRELEYVKDRWAILDCIMRQSRGHDRHDLDLMASVYHPDGIDEHGPVVKPGAEYGEYANDAHCSIFIDHLHNITTHTCEIDGEVAHAESYVIGTMRMKDHRSLAVIGGRYLDRLEKRDGAWKIVLRRCTIEWSMSADTSMIETGAFRGFLKGAWDHTDPSYARPMTTESPGERW